MPMTRGGIPAVAPPSTRACGVRSCAVTARAAARISAAAPSLTPGVLPAVMDPPAKSGASLSRASTEVARGCSSRSTTRGGPLRCGIVMGAISCESLPLACALALACEASAMASWAARLMPRSSAAFCAVWGMETVP